MSLPRRPYMLKAMYDWLLDSNFTPHLVVDVSYPGTRVPMEFVRDNQIILNITPNAVANFDLSSEGIRFNARFSGVPQQVIIPMAAVVAIYARENGAGMMFEPEPEYALPATEQATSSIQLVSSPLPEDGTDDDKPTPPTSPSAKTKGRPVFKVVK